MKVIAVAALAASLLAGAMPAAAQKNPLARQRADELFAADQALGAASAKSDGLAGLSAALADDVTVPLPGQGFADGKADVIAALRADGYDALSHADQGRRFSDQVGPRPERALLHKARLGRLDAGEVMRAQKTPEALGELERALAPS